MSNASNIKYLIKVTFVICFLFGSIASVFSSNNQASASENNPTEKELNDEAKFIQQEALITDDKGQPVGINLDKVKERHGYIPNEAKEANNKLKSNAVQSGKVVNEVGSKYSDASDCKLKEMAKTFGQALPPALISSIVTAYNAGNYTKALKALGKAGFKGTGIGTLYSIASISVQCDYKYGSGIKY